MTAIIDTHVCHVDCELIVIKNLTDDTVTTGHMMYPADPTPHAGRYQHTQNLNMTRRQYRESGQDESRNVRLWNEERRIAIENGTKPYGERKKLRLQREADFYDAYPEGIIP